MLSIKIAFNFRNIKSDLLFNDKKHITIIILFYNHKRSMSAFMTPEISSEDSKYDEKVDVDSFGVVMYFIVTKCEIPRFTGTGSYESLKLPAKINKLFATIIKKCWSKSPEERPSFSDIFKLIIRKFQNFVNI